MGKKVVLAYSGGLDTSVAVRWLQEEYGCSVVAVAVDVGQSSSEHGGEDWDVIKDRAMAAGAEAVEIIDAKVEMAETYCAKAIKANAAYEGKYPLVSALSRPVIVRHLVSAARRHHATTVAHGCTGKGNDQVRFEVGTRALTPDLDVLAPARVWGFSRNDCVDYAKRFSIPIAASKEKLYSIDENLFGKAIECGEIEDPWAPPPSDVYTLTKITTEEPYEVVIRFEQGTPVALDGRELPLYDIIAALNTNVGATGYGRLDMVENRRVGIKSREIYECPGALALIQAHRDLEDLTIERDLHHEKARLEPRWSELVYDGLWYSPLMNALDAFIESSQQHVTGEVRMRFSPPGVGAVVGRKSPVGLYDYKLATYDPDDAFRHQDAEGFVRLWGLGIATWAKKQGTTKGKDAS